MQDRTALTVDRLFNTKDFDSKAFGPARWIDNGSSFTTLESCPSDEEVKEILSYDISTGQRAVLVAADQIRPEGWDKSLIIKNYDWSPDRKFLLIFTNSKRVWRQNTRGDYWLLELQNGRLSQLGGDAKPSTLMFAKFAPDSQSETSTLNTLFRAKSPS
jgi:dipeptidyl-peptidase-4